MTPDTAKEALLNAHRFRHACKLFDENKKISEDDLAFVLETARLSPTSFGMQGCKLHVVTDPALKQAIKKVCWNQPQVDSCSHLIVLTTRTKDLEPGSDWVKSRFADRGMGADAQAAYYDKYASFHADLKSRIEGFMTRSMVGFFYRLFHKNRTAKDLYQWGARQCYIVLGNIMTAAAAIGIDSCPLEGMDKNGVEKALNLDTATEEVAVLCAFGYRVNAQPEKKRLPIETMTVFHH